MEFLNPMLRYQIGNYSFSYPGPLLSYSAGGIYALFSRNFLGQVELRYIGQAISFQSRVNFTHEAVKKILSEPGCIDVCAAYYFESNAVLRDQIEKVLIQQFKPRYNSQYTSMTSLLNTLKS